MTARFDLKGEIGQGTARAAALASFLKDNPGPVDLFINSPGGDAVEGAALMAEIQRHGNVTAHLQGICASAATLPAVAARRIVMHSAAILMIHEPAVGAWGTSEVLHSAGEALEKLTGIYAAAYASATGNDQALIRAWMKAETWLSAEDARELNFCDEIEATGTVSAPVAAFDYTKFKAPPAHLMRLAVENGWATASPEMKETQNV